MSYNKEIVSRMAKIEKKIKQLIVSNPDNNKE